jgi:hypothetical protein
VCFLPRNKVLVPMTSAAYHNPLHSDAYFRAVNALLPRAQTRDEALASLHQIRDQLLSGGFP